MAKLSPHTTGKLGHAARSGKFYFLHRASRMVRVDDFHTRPVPMNSGWEQVSLEEWIVFRKETKAMNPAKANKLHRSLYK